MKYICELCGYVYDESKGDPDRNIALGTPFNLVQASGECFLCGCHMEPENSGSQDGQRHSQR